MYSLFNGMLLAPRQIFNMHEESAIRMDFVVTRVTLRSFCKGSARPFVSGITVLCDRLAFNNS